MAYFSAPIDIVRIFPNSGACRRLIRALAVGYRINQRQFQNE
jgi:hypothetical protein